MNPQKRLSSLSHNELIEYMASHCRDNAAWREFMNRFQKFIAMVIIKECERLRYQNGTENIEDFLHTVYLRLLQNDCKALKNFKGRYQNSIISYLKLIALNAVRSDFKKGSNNEIKISDSLPIPIEPPREYSKQETEDFVDHCLKTIAQQRRNGDRDVLIFRYRVLQEFEIDEIAEMPEFRELSIKRLQNIVSEIRDEMRGFL